MNFRQEHHLNTLRERATIIAYAMKENVLVVLYRRGEWEDPAMHPMLRWVSTLGLTDGDALRRDHGFIQDAFDRIAALPGAVIEETPPNPIPGENA